MRCVDPDLSSIHIALEATGHNWLALHSFLREHGLQPRVINPIQSDAFRNMYIRKSKNDDKDAFIIAEVLRFGRYTTSELASEEIVALRQLSRFRFSLVDTIADLKRQVISILDMLFPEYERVSSDLFGKTSSELLMEYTTPEEIVAVNTEELATFMAKRSQNRLGLDKAVELKSDAESSFGIDMALDAYRLQLRLLLQQIRFTEKQLESLNAEIAKRLEAVDSN
jgi:transposase